MYIYKRSVKLMSAMENSILFMNYNKRALLESDK